MRYVSVWVGKKVFFLYRIQYVNWGDVYCRWQKDRSIFGLSSFQTYGIFLYECGRGNWINTHSLTRLLTHETRHTYSHSHINNFFFFIRSALLVFILFHRFMSAVSMFGCNQQKNTHFYFLWVVFWALLHLNVTKKKKK